MRLVGDTIRLPPFDLNLSKDRMHKRCQVPTLFDYSPFALSLSKGLMYKVLQMC